jgi:hypothetical protein
VWFGVLRPQQTPTRHSLTPETTSNSSLCESLHGND